jgi:cobalamin biosynthesis protein CobT
MSNDQNDDGMRGEGNDAAARRFHQAEEAFAKHAPVEEKAREAADALDRAEAGEIEAARQSTAAGDIHGPEKAPRRGGEQPPDARLDDRLKDSFPASDPVSTSPGSD